MEVEKYDYQYFINKFSPIVKNDLMNLVSVKFPKNTSFSCGVCDFCGKDIYMTNLNKSKILNKKVPFFFKKKNIFVNDYVQLCNKECKS